MAPEEKENVPKILHFLCAQFEFVVRKIVFPRKESKVLCSV